MKHRRVIALSCCGLLLAFSQWLHAGDDSKTMLVHYMPWYSSKPVSGHWGWHWTMGHYNPDKINSEGRREVASQYYPLVGAYDSSDHDVLACQVAQMKLAGLDGVIIDWYGTEDFRDYAALHQSTQHFIEFVKTAGLQFAVCYEDRTVKYMVEGGRLSSKEAVSHGQALMKWMQKNWFSDSAYFHLAGRPMLLVFGPEYFKGDQWLELFSDLSDRPMFYTLNDPQGPADGAFGWPPMDGGTTTPDEWRPYLERLYDADTNGHARIGAAFPMFHDIYKEAGLHRSYGFLDARAGKTFEETMSMAFNAPSEVIQIITWNDYGEGTIIEPTLEYGYRFLEIIQESRREEQGPAFPYTSEDLRLPVEVYKLRKKYHADRAVIQSLEEVSNLLLAGRPNEARNRLAEIKRSMTELKDLKSGLLEQRN